MYQLSYGGDAGLRDLGLPRLWRAGFMRILMLHVVFNAVTQLCQPPPWSVERLLRCCPYRVGRDSTYVKHMIMVRGRRGMIMSISFRQRKGFGRWATVRVDMYTSDE